MGVRVALMETVELSWQSLCWAVSWRVGVFLVRVRMTAVEVALAWVELPLEVAVRVWVPAVKVVTEGSGSL